MRSLIALLLLLSACVISAAEQNLAGIDSVASAKREFQNGKLDSAMTILQEAEKRGIRTGRSLDLHGCILMEQGKFDEAIKLFEAARESDRSTYGQLHTGDTLRRQQKWEEARAAYQAAAKETNILLTMERLRFGIFMTYLGAKDEERARNACEQITFPTESAAYYYAQAAWAFAHGSNRDGQNWIKRAQEIHPPKSTAWFARHLYDFGWLKSKPPLVAD